MEKLLIAVTRLWGCLWLYFFSFKFFGQRQRVAGMHVSGSGGEDMRKNRQNKDAVKCRNAIQLLFKMQNVIVIR